MSKLSNAAILLTPFCDGCQTGLSPALFPRQSSWAHAELKIPSEWRLRP